jgi:predicted SAM-dependent methyltransferase
MERINIIWTCDTWELDWLQTTIFKGVDYELIMDPDMTVVRPNSVIVMNETNEAKILEYIGKYQRTGCKYGIIHLSDEAYKHPTSHYEGATFVLRNYYSKIYADMDNVDFIPLGWSSGFTTNKKCKSPPDRKYFWNFIGQIAGKPTREAMVNAMAEIEGGYLRPSIQWNDPNGLKIEEYQKVLEDSVFTPSPAGWCNPDSFRLYEALEAGSIPIVDNIKYFKALFGEDIPFLSVKGWNEVQEVIRSKDEHEILTQLECIAWWTDQKATANKKFKDGVAKFFAGGPLKINLGCGDKKLAGYINLDINEKDCPDVVVKDITHLPYANDSVDEVRADAMYEHLFISQQIPMLQECKRILKPGGTLKINWLPDFEVYAQAYLHKQHSIAKPGEIFSLYDVYRYSHGDPENSQMINYRGDYQMHRDIFDKPKVQTLLDLSGPWSYTDIQNVTYMDEPHAVNLNIKAVK